jgi:hypothetical protein
VLALLLQGLIGDLARIDAVREARIVDPYECVCVEGGLRFHVEPSEREGRGPSTVYLLRDGALAWLEELPFTLREALVARDGAVLGCAVDEHLWFRGASESAFREIPPPYGAIPRSMVIALLDIGWENAALVRVRDSITDSNSRGRSERWWRFDFARGEWEATLQPTSGVGAGFELVLVDPAARALLATERGALDTSWLRVLDTNGDTLGLQLIGGIGFDPAELATRAFTCGIALRFENERLWKLDRERSFGPDLRPRLRALHDEQRERVCAWPHVRLASLGTSPGELVAEPQLAAPRGAERRLDGRWLNEVVACKRLPDGGYALVDVPMQRRGERGARLVLTDARGLPVDEHVLPFAGMAQVCVQGDWVAVVPIGRATVALLNRRTRERFELLTRTYGRDARVSISQDARELAVLDVERGSLERFRLDPR